MGDIDEITSEIVHTAVRLPMQLGPGLLESVYEAILARGLEPCGLYVECQKLISFEFDGLRFDEGCRDVQAFREDWEDRGILPRVLRALRVTLDCTRPRQALSALPESGATMSDPLSEFRAFRERMNTRILEAGTLEITLLDRQNAGEAPKSTVHPENHV